MCSIGRCSFYDTHEIELKDKIKPLQLQFRCLFRFFFVASFVCVFVVQYRIPKTDFIQYFECAQWLFSIHRPFSVDYFTLKHLYYVYFRAIELHAVRCITFVCCLSWVFTFFLSFCRLLWLPAKKRTHLYEPKVTSSAHIIVDTRQNNKWEMWLLALNFNRIHSTEHSFINGWAFVTIS